MNNYPGINIQGQILSSDLLESIANNQQCYQTKTDFGLAEQANLKDEIQFAYSVARKQWESFSIRKERIAEDEPGTSETRRYWMLPFLDALGYNPEVSNAERINGQSYAISHRDSDKGGFPIHLMGINDNLNKRRSQGGPRMSPHSLLQEYLNVTEHLFGLVSNGRKLRLLRDSTRLSRFSYIEFDLEGMMEDERYTDFAMMYRLIHASRMPDRPEESASSIIEQYHQDSVESGTRIREGLRKAVEEAIRSLGNGFLKHPQNLKLRQSIIEGNLRSQAYYNDLLQIIYRLLFIMVIEERKLIFPKLKDSKDPKDLETKRTIYYQYYSITRLRNLAEQRHLLDPEAEDLWNNLIQTFQLFEKEVFGSKLRIQALGGSLFNTGDLEELKDARLKNQTLLEAFDYIGRFEDEDRNMVRVNYEALDVEELGSVYEALLDYEPRMQTGVSAEDSEEFSFYFSEGTERKTTGSYYTRPELVQELIKSALVPVVEHKLKGKKTREEQEQAILSMNVCDPASGSGHFLLAAARKMGEYLAAIRTGEDSPSPFDYNMAVRDVIAHCIYGVDKNPMAVQLCKVSLWLESYAQGYPLSFLDHHIKLGDSIVGLDSMDSLKNGVPNDAFNPIVGDEVGIAKKIKKRNKKERKYSGQIRLQPDSEEQESPLEAFARVREEIDEMPESDMHEQQKKQKAYQDLELDNRYIEAKNACDLWTSSFFIPLTTHTSNNDLIPTEEILRSYVVNPKGIKRNLLGYANSLAGYYNFFHWPLEFPEVSQEGGFDVLLGNPPWERIKLQEKEFFQGKDWQVANADNKSERYKQIESLKSRKPELYKDFLSAKRDAEAQSKFARKCKRYPLTSYGDINTYQLFGGFAKNAIQPLGRSGIITPTGIATDDTCKFFFADLVNKKSILSLYDFENSKGLFSGVHRSYKFCLLTIGGEDYKKVYNIESEFANFLTHPNQLDEKIRRFRITPEELARINPNTRTLPVFRTRPDAELTKKIYNRFPVLVKKKSKNGHITVEENPWGISFLRMFDMSNDSGLFHTRKQMEKRDAELKGNRFVLGDEVYLPLYEGKSVGDYEHRLASIGVNSENVQRKAYQIESKKLELRNPSFLTLPEYWLIKSEVDKQVPETTAFRWAPVYKRTVTASSERTLRISVVPYSAVGDKIPLITTKNTKSLLVALLISNLNSIIADLLARFKTGYVNMGQFVIEQLPIFKPDDYQRLDYKFIVPRMTELVYTAWDIKSFADDVWTDADDKLEEAIRGQWKANKDATGGHVWELPDWIDAYPEIETDPDEGIPYPPFKWDEKRRARLRAELDAYYARLYGLTEEELHYILDPKDVYGDDFPGETFRVLKDKELKQYGEYRTKRLVLEAWDRLEAGRPMMSEEEEKPAKKEYIGNKPENVVMKEFTLNEGIYSVRDAQNVINSVLEDKSKKLSYDKVRRWFKELMDAQYEGLEGQEKKEVDELRISFHGLIELYVIGVLRDNNFKLRKILSARNDLGQKTGKRYYPFATNNVRDNLKVSGCSIIFDIPNVGKVTLDGTGQINLELIAEFFKDIEFDTDGIAKQIIPSKGRKYIVIDPKKGGGKPVIKGTNINVDIIARFYSGPDSIGLLKEQYNVSEEQIKAAVEYSENYQN